MAIDDYVDINCLPPVTTFAQAEVFIDHHGHAVIDVRDRTGLWTSPSELRELAKILEAEGVADDAR